MCVLSQCQFFFLSFEGKYEMLRFIRPNFFVFVFFSAFFYADQSITAPKTTLHLFDEIIYQSYSWSFTPPPYFTPFFRKKRFRPK